MIKKAPLLLFITVAVAVIVTSSAYTQSLVAVTGNVRNNKTKEFLPAVSVIIKNTTSGAYTDEKGNFKFTTTQKPPFTLVISSIGFATKEIEYTGRPIDVELEATIALGQDIVVAASRL